MRRPRFQFRLSTLLGAILVPASFFGGIAADRALFRTKIAEIMQERDRQSSISYQLQEELRAQNAEIRRLRQQLADQTK
jgi:hypothetical protein